MSFQIASAGWVWAGPTCVIPSQLLPGVGHGYIS